MIGLVGAKIWVENRVDFGNPVNLVGLAAGLIAGIGGVTLKITDDFSLSGIALGTILVIVFFHLVDRGQRPTGTPPGCRRGRRRRCEARTVRLPPPGVPRQEALAALAGEPNAKVLAGGQSLVPLLSMRLAAPAMLVDINGLPDLAHVRSVRRTGSGSGPWPGTPTCWPTPTPPGPAAAARWRWRTSPTRRSATAAPRSARSCTPTPRPRCRSCSGCSAARSTSASVARPPHDRRRRPVRSARSSRSLAHDEIAVEAFFPALAAGAGRRLRGDRPPARRLRPVRGRRPRPRRRRPGRRGPGRLPVGQRRARRSSTSPARSPTGSTDDALAAAGEPPWPSSSPPTTSTPPRPTGPSWCGC